MRTKTSFRTLRIAILAAAMTFVSTFALAAGPKLVVAMDEPFEVAGELHSAASLSLRTVHQFTPTTVLNEVWVGNRCLGLVTAVKRDDARLEASRNSVLFHRASGGTLVLRGFAYRLPGDRERYRYAMFVDGTGGTVSARGAGVERHDTSPVVMAAAIGG